MQTSDIPLNLDKRWEWIKFQLRLRGTSLARLARELRLNDRALRNAKYRPYPRIERAIAAALGLRPAGLWPERWNSDGTPHRQRPSRAERNTMYPIKDTEERPRGDSKTGRANVHV